MRAGGELGESDAHEISLAAAAGGHARLAAGNVGCYAFAIGTVRPRLARLAAPTQPPAARNGLLGLLVASALGCVASAPKAKPIASTVTLSPAELASSFIQSSAGPLHYVATGDAGRQPVIFVHGSPGSWRAFRQYLLDPDLASRAWLVSVDRPGFGGTDPGRAEPSLAAQAARIAPLLAAASRPAILVGHSLGGPVIARLAIDHPDRVAGLLFLSASVDPALERLRWYNRLATWPWLARRLPPELVISNREILPLRAELEALLPGWTSIRVPVLVLHGRRDSLVPVANTAFLARMLPEARVRRLPGAGHLLPWRRYPEVKAAVLEMLALTAEEETSTDSD